MSEDSSVVILVILNTNVLQRDLMIKYKTCNTCPVDAYLCNECKLKHGKYWCVINHTIDDCKDCILKFQCWTEK
jgi:hypothetical protein